jgi:hypothetical protein
MKDKSREQALPLAIRTTKAPTRKTGGGSC